MRKNTMRVTMTRNNVIQNMMKRMLSMSIVTMILISIMVQAEPQIAEASELRITISEFAEVLVKEIGAAVEGSAATDVLMNNGIINAGDFTDYSKDLTHGDMLMLLSRADDYLGGVAVEASLINEVIAKRISDISKVSEAKREDIAKGFIKGLMKGYSNGAYSGSRNLKLTNKVTKAGAIASIKMLKNKSLRAKISPDGQLIRTTNLPQNANLFPYILASYPNKYYEWQLIYQRASIYDKKGNLREMVKYVDYTSPADIDKLNIDTYSNFSLVRKERLNEWVEKAKCHLELVFSADYRTIGDEWFKNMLSLSYHYGTRQEDFAKQKFNEYIDKMKANKTIVEYKTIAVDGSSLYYFNKYFYMRVYVKYRVKSSEVEAAKTIDEYLSNHPYNKILFSNGFVKLDGFTLGEWKEGFYDIQLADSMSDGNIGVQGVWFDFGKELD